MTLLTFYSSTFSLDSVGFPKSERYLITITIFKNSSCVLSVLCLVPDDKIGSLNSLPANIHIHSKFVGFIKFKESPAVWPFSLIDFTILSDI